MAGHSCAAGGRPHPLLVGHGRGGALVDRAKRGQNNGHTDLEYGTHAHTLTHARTYLPLPCLRLSVLFASAARHRQLLCAKKVSAVLVCRGGECSGGVSGR